MNLYTKTLLSESTVLTATPLVLPTVNIADARNDSIGVIGVELIGTGDATIEYSATITEGDSTWFVLDPITLVADVRQTVYLPSAIQHFGHFYKFRLTGTATVTSATFGMV